MADLHFILQGKGGVGKSFIATILAEYFISKDRTPHCIDLDAVNQTFASFKKLNVHHLNILEDGNINSRRFDDLIERINDSKDDMPFIVDNGASSFLPMCEYLLSHSIISMLIEMNHQVFIHTLLAGGDAMSDTLAGFIGLSEQFSEAPLVVWLNEHNGKLTINGNPIEDEKVFTDHCQNVFAQVRLPKPKGETFGQDLINLRRKKLILAEGIVNEKFTIMMRHRLKVLQRDYFTSIELAKL